MSFSRIEDRRRSSMMSSSFGRKRSRSGSERRAEKEVRALNLTGGPKQMEVWCNITGMRQVLGKWHRIRPGWWRIRHGRLLNQSCGC